MVQPPAGDDDILAAALTRPASERASFLDDACASNPAQRTRLDRLLREHDDADPFLASGGALAGPLGDAFAEAMARDDALPPGSNVGAYQIVEEIGRGGMAVVYLASRVDGGFDQQVALKVIKRGADTDELLARFRQERQILARLNHPNIARLLDGGATADGRPFIAMELVAGERLDRHADAHQLDLDRRLDLFLTVARAVQHAHRHLIVHRDLKPSNILMTADGQIKLLDFGIARVLDDGSGAAATTTVHRLLTPQYASPEQLRGGVVTTATDVYQLGLLLYELLTGRAAQALDGLSPVEAERVIADVLPAPPSQVATRDPARRGWARRLRGDLDTIVLTAIAKSPPERYASVDRLIDDLERFQRGLPVLARPASVATELRKFIRRHRLATAASVAVVATIATIVTLFSLRLARERDVARREAATANQVVAFVQRLFEGSDPYRAPVGNPTARELLDRGAGRIDAELVGQPELQARLMTMIGDIYRVLGVLEPATKLHERALAIRRATVAPDDPALATSLHSLGVVLYMRSRFDQSRPLLEEGLRIRERALGAEHADVATSLDALGSLSRRLSQYDTARAYAQRAVAMRERIHGPDHERVATALNNLGLIDQAMGDHKLAAERYARAVAIHEKNHGPDHPFVGTSLGNLVEATRLQGNLEAATPLAERVVAITEKALGPSHADTGTAYNTLGSLLHAREQYDAALRAFERAQQVYEAALGASHPNVAFPIENIGNILKDTGHHDEAVAQFRRARAIREAAYGPVHSLVAQAIYNEGLAWLVVRNYATAVTFLELALETYRKSFPAGHPQIGSAGYFLGLTLVELKRYAEAEPLLLEAYPTLRDRSGATHRHTTAIVDLLVRMYDAWGRPDQAAPYRTLQKQQ
jgi:serine/threonine-protein kinase